MGMARVGCGFAAEPPRRCHAFCWTRRQLKHKRLPPIPAFNYGWPMGKLSLALSVSLRHTDTAPNLPRIPRRPEGILLRPP